MILGILFEKLDISILSSGRCRRDLEAHICFFTGLQPMYILASALLVKSTLPPDVFSLATKSHFLECDGDVAALQSVMFLAPDCFSILRHSFGLIRYA